MHLSWSFSSVTSCSSLQGPLMWLFHTCQLLLSNPSLCQQLWNKCGHHNIQDSVENIRTKGQEGGEKEAYCCIDVNYKKKLQPFHVVSWDGSLRVGQTDIYTVGSYSLDLYFLRWDKEVLVFLWSFQQNWRPQYIIHYSHWALALAVTINNVLRVCWIALECAPEEHGSNILAPLLF